MKAMAGKPNFLS